MINTNHKDRLFSFIFGREENKRWTLSLYNAVNHSSHTNPDDIQITTMDDVLYMGMKNDISFIITNNMNIYEQQSTFNPNMPLRKLMYAARLYDKYVHDNKFNIYGTKLIPLPVPKLVTFYNGMSDRKDEVLRLEDAFLAGAEEMQPDETGNGKTEKGTMDCAKGNIINDPDITVRVRMININYGKNKELMDACRPLAEYAWLVDEIRKHKKLMEIEEAVDQAIDEMPESFEIRAFLIGNRAEVKQMCITEYHEVETMEMFREEGRKEGREEGLKEGQKEGQKQGIKKERFDAVKRMIKANATKEQILSYGYTENEFAEVQNAMCIHA